MSTPEAKIKGKVRRRVQKLADQAQLPLFWDTPPASQFGAGGRPDHTVRIGTFCFHIECKANNWGKPTDRQAEFHATLRSHGEYTLTIAGDKGVDAMFDQIMHIIRDSFTKDVLEKRIADATAILEAAAVCAQMPNTRGQRSLDIKPGTGKAVAP